MESPGNNLVMSLAKPGPRLPWITDWLTSQVWSPSRYKDMSPEAYLTKGEQDTHGCEELIATAGDRFYDELSSAASQVKPLTDTIAE
ncbi:MAG: hypothetical protein WCL44_14505, partial [bacterium]